MSSYPGNGAPAETDIAMARRLQASEYAPRTQNTQNLPVATIAQAPSGQPTPYTAQPIQPIVVATAVQPGYQNGPGLSTGATTMQHMGNPTLVMTQAPLSQDDLRLIPVIRYGRATMLFACIDVFFLVLRAIMSPVYPVYTMLLVFMPLCGVYAGKTYRVGLAAVYAVYLGFYIVATLAMILASNSYLFLTFFIVLITGYILNIVIKFIKCLRQCSENDLQRLRSGEVERSARQPMMVLY